MKRAGLIASWVAMAALLSMLAYQIVAAAESQVSDAALTPIVAITAESSTTTTGSSTVPDASTTTVPSDSTTVSSTSTSTPSNSTTTAATTATSTTSSTSTTVGAAWTVRTVPSAGGEVVIEHRPGEERLVAARPSAGYKVEVESSGPPSVDVEFENESTDNTTRIRARWQDGQLSVTVEET